MFHALTGDETGLVKLLDLNEKTVLYNTYNDNNNSSSSSSSSSSGSHQCRTNGCKSMAWCDPRSEDTTSASMLRANGIVEFYKLPDPTVPPSSPSSDMEEAVADTPSATSSTVQLLSSLCLSDFEDPLECFPVGRDDQSERLHLCYSKQGKIVLVKSNEEYTTSEETNRFSVRDPVEAGCGREDCAVFGGRENDIQLFNINTQQILWKAKNVSNDKLSLRVPIYITAVKFLGETNTNKIITGTGYKQIRVYDVKAKRSPVVNFDIGGEEAYRITSILPSPDEKTVYIADSTGGLYLFDIGMRRRISTLKGNFGSIRDLKTDPEGQYLAAVGLDRYIRVYDTSTSKMVNSMYLKQRASCCLLQRNYYADETEGDNASSDDDSDDGEMDDGTGLPFWEKERQDRLQVLRNFGDDHTGHGEDEDDEDSEGEDDDDDDDDDDEEEDEEEDDDDDNDEEEDEDDNVEAPRSVSESSSSAASSLGFRSMNTSLLRRQSIPRKKFKATK